MGFADNVVTAANVVEKALPKYQHFCSDKKYNKGLATKHLLSNPCRATLPATLTNLWNMIAGLGSQHVQWGMSPPLVEDQAIVDILDRAQNVLDHGRDTLNVIAAASIVQELTASEQHTKAVEMNSKSGLNLPAALAVAIAALADAEPPSKKQKAK